MVGYVPPGGYIDQTKTSGSTAVQTGDTAAAPETTDSAVSEAIKSKTSVAPEYDFSRIDNWKERNTSAEQKLEWYYANVKDPETGEFSYDALNDTQKEDFDAMLNTYNQTGQRIQAYNEYNAANLATDLKSPAELTLQAQTDPMSMLPDQADVPEMETSKDQYIDGKDYKMGQAPSANVKTVDNTKTASMPKEFEASTVKTATSFDGTKRITSNLTPAQGEVAKKVNAAVMNPKNLAQLKLAAAQTGKVSIEDIEKLGISPDQLVEAVKFAGYTDVEAALSDDFSQLEGLTRQIQDEELVNAKNVYAGQEAVVAEAATAAGLDPAAIIPRIEGKLTDEAFAKAAQGDVDAQMTMRGQLTSLMSEFNDGKTPAWAAGAMRAANAAMAARGLGGSSMAAAAIVQAAMESAMPIAQNDAAVFERMAVTDLNNRQQTALANAAASQNMQMANLSFEQQRAISNSANAFALQSQSLSNQQAVVLANAQFKAGLQGQVLDIETQTALTNAARYAEVNNINLNNQQQAALQRSSENLQINLANLSNRQQSAIAKAQIEAAQKGQELTNEQQAAVLNAARVGEIANLNFTAEQQKAIEQARLTSTIDIANLDAKNAKILADAAAMSAIDTTNLNNRQLAQVENARNFLQMDLANLSNEQQTTIFKTQSRINSLLSDKAAENATRQFNAASETQVDTFFADMAFNLRKFNSDQVNQMKKFNAGETNAIRQFNTATESTWKQFASTQQLAIEQANTKWNQEISTQEFAATAESYLTAYKAAADITTLSYQQMMQKDRDMLSYFFQAGESAAERAMRLTLAQMDTKAQEKFLEMEMDFRDNAAKGQLIGEIAAPFIDKGVDAAMELIFG